jgi:hypothetical protein
MALAFEENDHAEYVDTGNMYRQVLFLGFMPTDDHANLRIASGRNPLTAHMLFAPKSADQYQIPEDETYPFVRMGDDWSAGWAIRARSSLSGLEPETTCGLCGWKPFEAEEEVAGG